MSDAEGWGGGCGALGVVMLVHAGFDRAEQLARHWAAAGWDYRALGRPAVHGSVHGSARS